MADKEPVVRPRIHSAEKKEYVKFKKKNFIFNKLLKCTNCGNSNFEVFFDNINYGNLKFKIDKCLKM